MRERRLGNHQESTAVSEPVVENLLRAAKEDEDSYPAVLEAMGHLHTFIDTDLDTCVLAPC